MASIEFGCWLVSGRRSNAETEAREENNMLESLGLSSKVEDWLVAPGTKSGSCDGENQEEGMMTGENQATSQEVFYSVAVKRIEEIISRGLQYWLCEPEINKKFDTALKIEKAAKGNLKRKMSSDANEMEEPFEKVNRL